MTPALAEPIHGSAAASGSVVQNVSLEQQLDWFRSQRRFDLALALAHQHSGLFGRTVVEDLRHERAAQLINEGTAKWVLPQARTRMLDQAIELLTGLTEGAPRRAADLFIAYVEREHFERALDFYGANAKLQWPLWIRPCLAKAYSHTGQPAKARELYALLSQEEPDNYGHRAGLFYALSDIAAQADAKTVADETVRVFAGGPYAASARILQVNSRHWAGESLEALRLVERAAQDFPASGEVKATYAGMLLALGRPHESLKLYEDVLSGDPEYLEARLGRVAALRAIAPNEATEFLRGVVKDHPASARVLKAVAEHERTSKGYVRLDVLQSADRDSRTTASTLEVASSALDDNQTRLVALATNHRYSLREGNAQTSSAGVGLAFRVGQTSVLGLVTRPEHSADAGLLLKTRSQLGDDLLIATTLNTAVVDVPARALTHGTSAKRLAAELRWSPTVQHESAVSVAALRLSDGNTKTSLAGFGVWRFEPGLGTQTTLTVRGGLDTSTRDDVAYFSPRRAAWAEVSGGLEFRVPAGSLRPLRLGVEAGLGVFDQDGYGSLGYSSLGANASVDILEGLSLRLSAQKVRRPYDGAYVLQDFWNLTLLWTLP